MTSGHDASSQSDPPPPDEDSEVTPSPGGLLLSNPLGGLALSWVADLANESRRQFDQLLASGWLSFLREQEKLRADMVRQFERSFVPQWLSLVKERERWLAQMSQPALSVMEGFSRAGTGNLMLTANLAAELASARVRLWESFSPQMAVVRELARMVEHRTALLTSLRPLPEVSISVALANRAWQDVVRVTPQEATARHVNRLEVVGRGTGWAIQAGVSLAERGEVTVVSMEADASVVLGPAAASAELRVRLSQLHPTLAARLDGAWERIRQGGAHAASQAAHSLMETIDWTLRLLAPDAETLAWHAAEKRAGSELHDGRPTRTLRVRFAVRNQPEKNSGLDLYLKATGELVGVIQNPKHALVANHERTLAPVALTVEGLLLFLLAD
jgi:hypothetical protein